MFYGQYNLILDQKGRLALPRLIRDGVTSGALVVREGYEAALYFFDKALWEEQVQRYLEAPIESDAGRSIRRVVFSKAQIVKVDEQGRITVPQRFLAYAGIEKTEIILLGAGDHFELWQEANLEKEINESE